MSAYRVDRAKWQRLNIFEQMGNISSEVGRSFKYLQSDDKKMAEDALTRAIDLLDATSSGLAKKHSYRAKEVLRAKEEYLHAFYKKKDSAGIERYFNQFAVAARIGR
jgi:hypothetical protein